PHEDGRPREAPLDDCEPRGGRLDPGLLRRGRLEEELERSALLGELAHAAIGLGEIELEQRARVERVSALPEVDGHLVVALSIGRLTLAEECSSVLRRRRPLCPRNERRRAEQRKNEPKKTTAEQGHIVCADVGRRSFAPQDNTTASTPT